ncbi:hypothetical protein [Microbulbifer celer]|uniref:Integron Cassette Protein Hfx-Cass5 domain-containing protein n=1 Tax=Microbulbifer celer TaxID=435905 RepID=A0ABW3UE56_9GAMM|nr:hypothetical protein [Microbulbifer celer]UFN55869.1 hypothetical protein LPW13_09775 [Microbulbifer celer]
MEDKIKEIGIDGEGRLYLKPAVETFPMIYREAMEVHWSSEHGCKLVASSDVTWVNIPAELQAQIVGEQGA